MSTTKCEKIYLKNALREHITYGIGTQRTNHNRAFCYRHDDNNNDILCKCFPLSIYLFIYLLIFYCRTAITLKYPVQVSSLVRVHFMQPSYSGSVLAVKLVAIQRWIKTHKNGSITVLSLHSQKHRALSSSFYVFNPL